MLAKVIALVLPLCLDTFAVAAALGIAGLTPRQRTRLSFMMTGFEAGTPLIGLGLGAPLGSALGSDADYVAICVLVLFGLYALLHGDDDEQDQISQLAELTGSRAVLLGLSISLDELAVGFSLGLLGLPVVPVILLIAVQTLIVSQLGARLGGRLSERAREGADRLAGLELLGLGVVLLVEKLAA